MPRLKEMAVDLLKHIFEFNKNAEAGLILLSLKKRREGCYLTEVILITSNHILIFGSGVSRDPYKCTSVRARPRARPKFRTKTTACA